MYRPLCTVYAWIVEFVKGGAFVIYTYLHFSFKKNLPFYRLRIMDVKKISEMVAFFVHELHVVNLIIIFRQWRVTRSRRLYGEHKRTVVKCRRRFPTEFFGKLESGPIETQLSVFNCRYQRTDAVQSSCVPENSCVASRVSWTRRTGKFPYSSSNVQRAKTSGNFA